MRPALAFLASVTALAAAEVTFTKQTITKDFVAEGCAVADFNHDGQLDVAAGRFLWLGPDFKEKVAYTPERNNAGGPSKTPYNPSTGYSDYFIQFAYDFTGDGWMDLLVFGLPGEPAFVFVNPAGKGGDWARHNIFDVADGESPAFVDVNGDGKPELLCHSSDLVKPKTAKGGTDFVYSTEEIYRPDRGMYHQSNIGHIRYDKSGEQSPNGIYGGFGVAPVITRNQNDLLWAEAELRRSGGNLTTAANLINNTRVDRGGLSAATAGEGQAALLTKLIYEQEIELLGLGAAPYYQRRRVTGGLLAGTPREMPVPAKELAVKNQEFYTFGGTGLANSVTPP